MKIQIVNFAKTMRWKALRT